MNKKGFTTIELVLTIVLVVIIMMTITSVTYTYRDRSNYEELITEVTNYKNTLTKIIYDDLLDETNLVTKIEEIDSNNYNLISENNTILLTVLNNVNEVGINYNGVKYLFPNAEDGLVEFKNVEFKEDTTNGLYSLDIIFQHKAIENETRIHFAIS